MSLVCHQHDKTQYCVESVVSVPGAYQSLNACLLISTGSRKQVAARVTVVRISSLDAENDCVDRLTLDRCLQGNF